MQYSQETRTVIKMINIENYNSEIIRICRKYNVKLLAVFGSALSEDFTESSDIDFLLELDKAKDGIKRYMNIKFELENLFNRSVDLIMPKAIRNNRIKNYIFSNIRDVYEA